MNSTLDKPSGSAASHTAAAPTQDLIGEELIAYEVDGDGSRFRMTFNCANRNPRSLSLPPDRLHALIMTLPRMMTQSLSSRSAHHSLLQTYPPPPSHIQMPPNPTP